MLNSTESSARGAYMRGLVFEMERRRRRRNKVDFS